MSAVSQQTSTSQSSNQTGCVVDPLDLLDFTDYDSMPDGLPSYESPSLSPSSSKAQFTARPPATVTPPTTLPPSTMAGPSHQYDQYKQQTPFVPGALASTMAVNQNIAGYDVNYMPPEMTSPEDIFDFNTAGPAQNSMSSPEMDMDFEPSGDAGFFFEPTVNPNAIGSREAQTPVATSNVGRMYPGMHQQAALAKARAAQQQQQQQIIQQQQRQQQQQQQQQQGVKHQRTKSNQPSDPIVEQKITQLLNSMRAQSAGSDGSGNSPLHNLPRTKKDEEDMDDDERLLNSEEGKKLSSKERRQLRNKVSARAFRSRRKEYISQLESEIASKVSENGDLRSQNRALMDENRRLSDLTRMLLSSSSFSNFLEHLSTNPAAPTPAQAAQPQRAEQRREEPRQAPKDVNPYAAAQQAQPPTNMVMVPEQTMEFSMLNINNSNEAAFNYQPQVFSVVETPEIPEMDITALSGKGSDNLSFETEQGKVEIPVAEAPVLLESAKPEMPETPAPAPSSTTAVADLDSDIFDDETATPTKSEKPESADLFAGVQLEKASARYVLVDVSDEEAVSNSAMMRVQRITASIEATMNRLERLTAGL